MLSKETITTTNNFMKSMEFVSKWEGGFSNDKVDLGGKTKYGISDNADGTIDGLINGKIKVEELTREEALKIYYDNYWLPSGASGLPLEYALVIFDTAVNCGVSRAKAIDRVAKGDPYKYIVERISFYTNLIDKKPALRKFYKGWINRCTDLKKYVDVLRLGNGSV